MAKKSLGLQGFLSIQAPVPRPGGLTEGATTVRQLGSVFLFPERFMQSCTHSACGPRLPAESSTCQTAVIHPLKVSGLDARAPLRTGRAP